MRKILEGAYIVLATIMVVFTAIPALICGLIVALGAIPAARSPRR